MFLSKVTLAYLMRLAVLLRILLKSLIMNDIKAIDWKLLFSKVPYDGTRGHTMKLEKNVIHLDIHTPLLN